jgi:hypothetical protein
MSNKKYYDIWTKFMSEYPEYFNSLEERWIMILDKVCEYMEKNKDSPSRYAKDKNNSEDNEDDDDNFLYDLSKYDKESNLGSWLATQKNNFKNVFI